MACAAAGTVSATPIPVGYLSFAPDAPFAGQTSISLVNASGAFGCFVDAPVCTEIAIEGTLSLDYGAADVLSLPLLARATAGLTLPAEWILNRNDAPLKLSFSGFASPALVQLADGRTVQLLGSVEGQWTGPGVPTDVLLFVESAVPIPEPQLALPVAAALIALGARRRPF